MRAGVLVGEPGVPGQRRVQLAEGREALLEVERTRRGDPVLLGVQPPGRHHLGADLLRAVRRGAELVEHRVHGLALGVRHQGDHVAVAGLRQQPPQPLDLGGEGGHVVHAHGGGAAAQDGLELVLRLAAQVLLLVHHRDPIRTDARHLPHAVEELVGAVADAAQAEQQPRSRRDHAPRHAEQRLEPGLVVRQVDDHGARAGRLLGAEGQRHGEGVHPAGVLLRVRGEGPQPRDHVLDRQPEAETRCGSGHRVGHVVLAQTEQGHRHVQHGHEPHRVGALLQDGERAVHDGDRSAVVVERLAQRGRLGVEAEHERAAR